MTDTYCVVLECGSSFAWYDHGGNQPQVGWFFACDDHSPIVGYDPDDGSPKHDRDQRVVRVSLVKSGCDSGGSVSESPN